MEIIIFFIILYISIGCSRKVPFGKTAIVRRNGEIYRTYTSGTQFYINPFTDKVEYVANSAAANMVGKVQSYASRSSSSTNTQRTYNNIITIQTSAIFRTIDNKSLSTSIYAVFKTTGASNVSRSYLEGKLKEFAAKYYSQENYEDISENATMHELKLFDILRDALSTNVIKLEKFESTPSNARITTRNTSKTECSHYGPTDRRSSASSSTSYDTSSRDYSYSQGNAIKGSLSDYIATQRSNPISSSDSTSDDPIKDTLNITTIYKGPDVIDVNNMDSNVDPIQNKN